MSLLLRRRAMMFRTASVPEVWDYGWDYTMGAPDTSEWIYPDGAGTAVYEEDNGLHMTAGAGAHAGLLYTRRESYYSQKSVLEVTVKVVQTNTGAFRIVLTSGNPGASDGKGLHVTVKGGYLNVLRTSVDTGTVTKTTPITYNAWHTVRLELDIPADASKVYLDGRLVDTVTNADLSTSYATKTWCVVQGGECYVRALHARGDSRIWLYRSGIDGYACEAMTGGWKAVKAAGIYKSEIGLWHDSAAEIDTVNAIPSGTLYVDVMGEASDNALYAFKVSVGGSQLLSQNITDGVRRSLTVSVPAAGVLKLQSYFGKYHVYNVWMED